MKSVREANRVDCARHLAALATLKGIIDIDKYQSPYQVLAVFIRYVIKIDALHSFPAVEIRNRLVRHFGFTIPEVVVKTALKGRP